MRIFIAALTLCAMLTALSVPGLCGEIDLSPTPTPMAVPAPAALGPVSEGPLLENPPIHMNCAAALLMEADSGQIIFQMNADAPRPVASVTKVMTILLTLEQLASGRVRAEDGVTVSRTASGMGGSQVLLDTGERQTVGTLLKCMIVGSANDAAVALAEALYGSEALCVDAMNHRAEALGMAGTRFENCTGLPAEGQHTTARDVAVMARQMFAHPRYFDYSDIWLDEVKHDQGRVTQLVNTNKLLRLYDGCDGGKTGSTKEAGYCVAATASRGGMRLVAVVLGADSGAERFDIVARMLDHGFADYRRYPVAQRGTRIRGELPVTGGNRPGVALALDSDLTLLVNRGEEQRIQLVPNLPESLAAPVKAGNPAGSVRVTLDGRTLAELPVVATEDVAARGLAAPTETGFRLTPEGFLVSNQIISEILLKGMS